MAVTLCDNCGKLSFDQINGKGHTLFSDFRDLRASATGPTPRCNLCSLIWWSLRHESRKLIVKSKDPDVWSVRLYRNPPNGPCQRVDVLVMPPNVGHDFLWVPEDKGLYHLGPPDDKPWIARGHLTAYVDNENSKPEDFAYRLPEANSGSVECLKLANKWLSDCMTTHLPKCRENIDCILPTRLVKIDSQNGVTRARLVTTKDGERGGYLALSYCWGKTPFFKMTSTNKDDLHESIPFEELPRTIQDSITLTKYLGFEYLWVDSLCIIQGTDEVAVQDFDRESKTMHRVFSNSVLTIAASAAPDAHSGLFQDRPAAKMPYTRLPFRAESKESIYLGADLGYNQHQTNHLINRGWAFQEAVLSNRVLSYGFSELRWKCHSRQCREGHIQNLSLDDDPTTVINKDNVSEKLYHSWIPLVESYSKKQLTFAKDKLSAIDGLASLVSNTTGRDYCFGTWEDRFCDQLLWKHNGRRVGSKLQYSRQDRFRAPSWSWASVDGSVKFLDVTGQDYASDTDSKTSSESSIASSTTPISTLGALSMAVLNVLDDLSQPYIRRIYEKETLTLLQKLRLGSFKYSLRDVSGTAKSTLSSPWRSRSPRPKEPIRWLDSQPKGSPFVVRAVSGTSLLVEGRLDKIKTLRYETHGQYYGAYENYAPWMNINRSVETFLDDLNDIPENHRKVAPDCPTELVNVWFLFVGEAEGLILVPEPKVVGRFAGTGKRKLFRRIGVFTGYQEPSEISIVSRHPRIEII